MKAETWFEEMLESFKGDIEFKLEGLKLDITERICELMEVRGINRKQLAEIIGSSPAFITKILNGNSNFTLKTMLSLADALGCKLAVKFEQKELSLYSHTDVLQKRTTAEDAAVRLCTPTAQDISYGGYQPAINQ
jgi:transcriptional regulator with XRE-family HTH domain